MIDLADCDNWRRTYDDMTVLDQKAFYGQIWREYREQAHFNADRLTTVIEAQQPRTVVELGGWDGECAGIMLNRFPCLMRWWNVEICEEACAEGLKHPRYAPVCLENSWYWEHKWQADMFVASHTIEHLKAKDLEAAIAATTAKTLYFDTPLEDEGKSWWGSTTTHILEIGWNGIDEICGRYGYRLEWRKRHPLEARSGGWSAVSVYMKDS